MRPVCAIEGCHREAKTRGWCNTHYERWRLKGDPEAGHPVRRPVLGPRTLMGRFWAKVRANDATGCWEWTGAASKTGYGTFNVGGRYQPVYRFAYERLVGPIPEGLTLDHLCRNPRCVNPAHLEPVTQAENTRRMIEDVYLASATCKRGHDRAAHMRSRPNGSAYCAECHREAQRRRHAERKEAV
jgi:hypothetical protein